MDHSGYVSRECTRTDGRTFRWVVCGKITGFRGRWLTVRSSWGRTRYIRGAVTRARTRSTGHVFGDSSFGGGARTEARPGGSDLGCGPRCIVSVTTGTHSHVPVA